jgi:putative membrane protein
MKDIHEEELRTTLARERNELARNRTRLANRRTFLAWCRTALSFMTFGFLLEKVDAFVMSSNVSVSKVVLSELGTLGKFAFMGGPVLMLFAGWRYYCLEKEMGFERSELYIFPEMLLFGVILGSAIIYVFL